MLPAAARAAPAGRPLLHNRSVLRQARIADRFLQHWLLAADFLQSQDQKVARRELWSALGDNAVSARGVLREGERLEGSPKITLFSTGLTMTMT